jgi:iron complex outermembrane receptor protein
MHSKHLQSMTILLSGVAAIALCQEAQAQSTSNSPRVALEEVVVTATRKEELLKDVPMSVDVATGKQIEDLNIFDFKDVASLSPGLQLTNTVGRNNIATIRGISYDPDTGAPPSVDMYFNELPADIQTVMTAIYDVGQVEVLKGPQGIFRGRTSPAGAMTLTTRKPSLTRTEGYVQGTASRQDARNFQGALSTPIIENILAVRIAGLIDRNDINQVHNFNTGLDSHGKTESGRVSLEFQPSDVFHANLTYQYLQARNRQYQQVFGPGNQPSLLSPQRSGPALTIEDRGAVSEGTPQYNNNTHLVALNGAWEVFEHTLSFVAGHQGTVLRQTQELDSANAVPGYIPIQRVRTPYHSDTAEARLASKRDSFWNYTVGFYFNQSRSNVPVTQPSYTFFANAVPATPFPFSSGLYLPIDVSIYIPNLGRDEAVFGSSDFQLTEALKLQVGARYTSVHVEQQSILTVSSTGSPALRVPPFTQGPTVTIKPSDAVRNYHPFTGGASLSYQLSKEMTTYLSYARSFRRGSAQVAITTPLDSSLLVTRPEKSQAVELGIKGFVLDGRLNFTADIYYQTFTDYLSRGGGVATSSLRNGIVDGNNTLNSNGDARGKGIEGSLSGKLADTWNASVGMAYNDLRYHNATVPCNDYNFDGIPDANGTPAVRVGQQVMFCTRNDRINLTSKFYMNAQSEYFYDMGSVQPFVRGLFTYRPGFSSQTGNFKFPSLPNLNMFAGVRSSDGTWSITVFARNIFDTQRITGISQNNSVQSTTSVAGGSGAPFDSGYRQVSVTQPREWGATLQYRF